MMKATVKILVCLLSLCLCLGSFASCGSNGPKTPEDTTETPTTEKRAYRTGPSKQEEKTIDIYLIAGQSNAAGSSYISDTAAAYAFAPELENGFSNILFTGKASDTTYLGWDNVKLGQGTYQNESFGPEAGMAKALSVFYNEETGKTAGFIKVAFGGNSLLSDHEISKKYGTWTSPSFAQAKGYSYGDDDLIGKAYRTLLSTVKLQLSVLEYKGYTDFRIKGLYWMQGENDRKYPEEYQEAFGYLVQDLRRDLSALVKEITGDDDRGASDLPIWVGTISRTFESAFNSDQKINAAFIEMQKGLADEQNKIFVVDNSTYDINYLDDKMYSRMIDRDQWHWNQPSQLAIGENVGNAMAAYFNLS